MEDNKKRYWKGMEELSNDIEFVKLADKEFPTLETENNNRRDFLKFMGFSVAAASLAACEAPIKKSIPFLNKPENYDPSIPNYYASTYFEDGDFASILVKTREGRPVKIEGNNLSPISKGKTSSKAQASVMSLYDNERYQSFMKGNASIEAKIADKEIKAKLASSSAIRIVSSTIISPSTKKVIADFITEYPNAKHIVYDTASAHGILQANKASFGTAMIPSYDFSKAEVIVGFGCDFLGTWISPVEFARQYGQTRKLGKNKKQMSRHFQFESRMSMTGANADYRVAVKPSQEASLVAALYQKLNGGGKYKEENIDKILDKAAKELQAANGKSVVVSGSNDPAVQQIVNAINTQLGNYGATIDTTTPLNLRQGNDDAMNEFVADVKSGSVDAVIFYNVNPVFNHALGKDLQGALSKVKLKISTADRPDETAVLCDYVCPDTHYLESWNDAEPKKGHFTLAQPTITPLFATRAVQESLLTWSNAKNTNFYNYIRGFWSKLFATQSQYKTFDDFWNNVLHDGVFDARTPIKVVADKDKKVANKETKEEKEEPKKEKVLVADVDSAIASVNQTYKESSETEIQVYEKVSMGNGSQANNPWLQEMPDPITKACWDNYLTISKKMANDMKLSQGDVVKVTSKELTFEIPVLIQPGQSRNSVAVALGYGREVSGKVGKGVGVNVVALTKNYFSTVKIEKSDKPNIEIAQTQTHHTIMGRDIIQESTFAEYKVKPAAGRRQMMIHTDEGLKKPTDISLWKGHKYPNHSWGMVIDLNSCIGCSACHIACQSENNIPVVGKKEVLNRRDMHWIRIDRYYSSDADPKDLQGLEEASENPEVTFMPMMCQHCNNAPCETVCPVLATTHSTEGLNQMAYNRCIGTRYCANNCPYKVRRFNWFHYAEDTRFTDINLHQTQDLGRMVLNPDVTVRSRGVMEKCSMCVQRIQAGKLEAKKEKRKIKDGEVVTACAQVCPTDAITFGDMNDPESKISIMIQEEHDARAYHVLDEINVKPQVSYLTKIRNVEKPFKKEKGHKKAEHKEESHS